MLSIPTLYHPNYFLLTITQDPVMPSKKDFALAGEFMTFCTTVLMGVGNFGYLGQERDHQLSSVGGTSASKLSSTPAFKDMKTEVS